jgi:hypothetical protein
MPAGMGAMTQQVCQGKPTPPQGNDMDKCKVTDQQQSGTARQVMKHDEYLRWARIDRTKIRTGGRQTQLRLAQQQRPHRAL